SPGTARRGILGAWKLDVGPSFFPARHLPSSLNTRRSCFMNRLLFGNVVLLVFLGVFPDPAQAQESGNFSCPAPREDALSALCEPPTSEIEAAAGEPVQISLTVPEGTPLRIALDQRTRVLHVGEPVHGQLVEPVYAFDQQVIPAGSVVTGRITGIDSVPVK